MTPTPESQPSKVLETLRRASSVMIVSHLRPDPDCLGSTLALGLALESMGKRVTCVNGDGVPKRYGFLPGSERLVSKPAGQPHDVTVYVDCGGSDRVGVDFRPQGITINIDHHASNPHFADVNWVDIEAAATAEILTEAIERLESPLTRDIATNLYAGLMTDTGGFRFANTRAHTLQMAADLVAAGASPSDIARAVYETRSLAEVRLVGTCFSRLTMEADGAFAWSELRNMDYAAAGGREHEPEGLSGDLRSIEGVELAILFQETEDGRLRASLRGRGGVSCAELAEKWGGGGHHNAAGYTSEPGIDYEQRRNKLIADSLAAVRAAAAAAR